MKRIRIGLICVLGVVGFALRSTVAPTQAQSASVVVTIGSYAFSPATITIAAGTTVVWSNTDPVDHYPTSDTGAWDTSDIGSGQTSSGTVFNTAGTYPYHCAIHPDMHGTIIVLAGGVRTTPTPSPFPPPAATATTVPISVSTSTPLPTLGPVVVPTATAAPSPTATNTLTPLFVRLALGHGTVKAGAKQSVKVTTLSGAAVSIVVTFPVGAGKHRTATAPASGTFVWTFKQPGGHTTRAKHTARVAVTVSGDSGSSVKASKSYRIS